MRATVVDLGSQPMRNLTTASVLNLVPNTAGLGASASGSAELSDPVMGRYRRFTVATAVTPSAGTDMVLNQVATPVVPGRWYTTHQWVRASIAQAVRLQHQMLNSGGGGAPSESTSQQGPDVTLVPNQLTLLTWRSQAPSTAVSVRTDIDGAAVATRIAWTPGDTLEASRPYTFDSTDGRPTGAWDGDLPTHGWRWTGTPGASASVGYPYTLESIAGPPGAVLDGTSLAPGNTSTLVGTLDTSGVSGRTAYSVHDVLTTSTAGDDTIVRFAPGQVGVTRARLVYGAGGSGFSATYQPSTEVSGFGIAIGSARVVGRHVGALAIGAGLIDLRMFQDGSTSYGALSVTTPFTDASVRSQRDGPGAKAVFTVAYPVGHDQETMRRVIAWLARKYGAPIPAGY